MSTTFSFPALTEEITLPSGGGIFRLYVKREGALIAIPAADFGTPEVEISEDGATYLYGRGGSLEVLIRLRQVGAEVIATLDLVNRDDALTVQRVQFPYIAYDRVLPFDRLLMASAWGDDIPMPVRTIRHYCDGRDQGFWVYDYVKATEDEISYAYPSIMAMQFMVLHNPGRALYLACYGMGDETRTFNAQIYGRDALALSVNHYPFLRQGRWTAPACAFALLPGGWHAAADLYAGHMRERFTAPDLPAWMRDDDEGFHGWVSLFMRREGQPPLHTFKDLPEIARRVRASGLDIMHIAGWTYDGFDTYYPDFEHDPQLGTAAELREALQEIRAEGGRTILYINGRLVDPRSAFYRDGGDRELCVDEGGQAYVERYGTSAEFRIACPACHDYGDYIAGRIANLISRYGANAAQVDQISCNHGYFCYDDRHPHPTPATNFLPGVEHELRALRAAHQALDPEFFVWCEGCHERFGQFYDVNQGHGEEFTWALGDGVPELFSYVYPDLIVTGLCSNIQQLCYTYAQGKPFDTSLRLLEDPAYAELLRKLVAVRKQYPAFFLRGRFIDARGLTAAGSVRVFGVESRDGDGLLVNLWSPGIEPGVPVSVTLRTDRPDVSPRGVFPDDLVILKTDGWLTLSWRGPVATLIV